MPKKTLYKRNPAKKQTRLAFLILFFIVIIILVGQTVRFTQSLFKPISASSKSYSWEGNTSFSIVIKGQGLSLVNFDPSSKKLNIVDIPDETYLDVPGGFGNWVARSVYDLGQSENPPQGGLFLEKSLTETFGTPVEGFINLKKMEKPEDFITEIRKSPFKSYGQLRNLETDLSPIEFMRLSFAFAGVRFDKVLTFDLMDQNILDQSKLSDGTDILAVDSVRMDSFVATKLVDTKIQEEQLSIAVFNTTSTPGLAQKVSRIITNMGGNVIISSNAPTQDIPGTLVFPSDGKSSYTLKRLMQVFAPSCDSSEKCVRLAKNLPSSRASINAYLKNL